MGAEPGAARSPKDRSGGGSVGDETAERTADRIVGAFPSLAV